MFRKLLGGALLRSEELQHPCLEHWKKQDAKTCERCSPMEDKVLNLLRSHFRFRAIVIDDGAERNRFEQLLIATLSACCDCRGSTAWLGQKSYSDKVRKSGLWNERDVDGPVLDELALAQFAEAVVATIRWTDKGGVGTDAPRSGVKMG